MLPSNPAVSLVQNYLRSQQGVIEVAKPTPDQLALTVGERVQATVTGQLPNGRFAVLIKDQLLDLNLPRNTQPGELLELVVAAKEPRLAFLLSQSQNPRPEQQQATGVALSQVGKQLGEMLNGAGSKVATLQQQAPLFEEMPEPAQLAQQLATRLTESGLFYESHQAEWVSGDRTLQSLLREPQARLPAEANRSEAQNVPRQPLPDQARTVSQGSARTISPELARANSETQQVSVRADADQPRALAEASAQQAKGVAPPEQAVRHLVQQQVQLLENHPLVWQGQAWPGQPLQWQLQLENEKEAARPELDAQQVWQTRLDLDLPRLGSIGVSATLRAGQFSLRFEAGSTETVALLRSSLSQLADRFELAGLHLATTQVHHHVDEIDS